MSVLTNHGGKLSGAGGGGIKFKEIGRLSGVSFNTPYHRFALAKDYLYSNDNTTWSVVDLVNNEDIKYPVDATKIANGYLAASSHDDYLFALVTGNKLGKINKNMEVVWTCEGAGPVWNTLCLTKNYVYYVSNNDHKVNKVSRDTGITEAVATIPISGNSQLGVINISDDGTKLIFGCTTASNGSNMCVYDANDLTHVVSKVVSRNGIAGHAIRMSGDKIHYYFAVDSEINMAYIDAKDNAMLIKESVTLGALGAHTYLRSYTQTHLRCDDLMILNHGSFSQIAQVEPFGTTDNLFSISTQKPMMNGYTHWKMTDKRYATISTSRELVHGIITK